MLFVDEMASGERGEDLRAVAESAAWRRPGRTGDASPITPRRAFAGVTSVSPTGRVRRRGRGPAEVPEVPQPRVVAARDCHWPRRSSSVGHSPQGRLGERDNFTFYFSVQERGRGKGSVIGKGDGGSARALLIGVVCVISSQVEVDVHTPADKDLLPVRDVGVGVTSASTSLLDVTVVLGPLCFL